MLAIGSRPGAVARLAAIVAERLAERSEIH